MKLVAVRHGETDENKNEIAMGQEVDASLNETGIRQAKKLSEKLTQYDIDLVISSPLKRASETAMIIVDSRHESDMFLIHSNQLKERSYGDLGGESLDKIRKLKTSNESFDYAEYNGESNLDFQNRVRRFLDKIRTQYPFDTILLVTHGGVIRMINHILKIGSDKIKNASINEYDLE